MFEAVLRSRWSDSTIMAATTNQPRPLACHSGAVKMAACSKMSEREKEERRPLLWAKARSTELRLGWHANSDGDDYFWCFCLSEYNVESEEARTGSWQWNQWKVILFCRRFIQKKQQFTTPLGPNLPGYRTKSRCILFCENIHTEAAKYTTLMLNIYFWTQCDL